MHNEIKEVNRLKVVAIIQARLGSSRLPGKVLRNVGGKPLIQFIISRLRRSLKIKKIVVATTTSELDDELVNFLSGLGVLTFRGSELDVLDRYYRTALEHKADIVVRITADDPLKCPNMIDQMIQTFIEGVGLEYLTNSNPPSYPEGADIEIFTFKALERVWEKAQLPSDREHVTPYIYNSAEFVCSNISSPRNLSAWRWTLDYEQDLEFINTLFKIEPNLELLDYKDIVMLIERNPEVVKINQGIIRNEGYLKSRGEENE